MESTDGSRGGRRSKVARLIDEYDLDGMGAELERQWTADEGRRSLRDLAGDFNRRILERSLESADVRTLEGEVENLYRLLSDEEVSAAERTRARRRLEREDIDVDDLQGDFVTYQAIRTYLKRYRDAEYTREAVDPIERETTNVQQLSGRVASVTEGKVERLRDVDEISLGEFRTLVDVQVVCEDCNAQFDVVDLLERGGCDCAD